MVVAFRCSLIKVPYRQLGFGKDMPKRYERNLRLSERRDGSKP